MKRIFLLLLIVVFAGVAIVGYQFEKFANVVPSDTKQEVIYEVLPGKTLQAIANDLEEKGLVTSATKFRWYARMKGIKAKVGEYALHTQMVPGEILQIISSGKSIARSFTVSEGLNVYEISLLYEKEGFGSRAEFLKLVFDQNFIQSLLGEKVYSLEGYLFPETYAVTKYMDARALLTAMVKRFLYVYAEIEPQNLMKKWTRHQLVTLASIVEKETGAPEERPLISAVFHNRINKSMRLQTDPTVLYGILDETKKYRNNITREDLHTPNRYNTYTQNGLPYGPISNPGKEAMLAVMRPAESPYLYFVSKNDGTHVFTTTYEDHTQAVKRFQLDAKAREGKSWRDLKKRGTTEAHVQ